MLRVDALRLAYRSERGLVEAVAGVSFTVPQGAFYTLLGPSGCGKTSTLRCIAGLEHPTDGTIEIGDAVVFSSTRRIVLPSYRRDIGMVFQSYAIWPHLTVFENVAFPLRHGRRRLPRGAVRDKVTQALDLVGLGALAERPAPLLSGGQQQRVALARALVREPAVLLLDEPLCNLDSKLRESMRYHIKELVHRLRITTLYVTHDQLEALTMSDTVALMREGRIVQSGPPRDVYLRPGDAFVAGFLGRTNLVGGRVGRRTSEEGEVSIETPWGVMRSMLPPWASEGASVRIGFRPEYTSLSRMAPDGVCNILRGTVAAVAFAGQTVEYKIDLGGLLIDACGEPFATHAPGEPVFIGVAPERCYVLPPEGSDATGSGDLDVASPSQQAVGTP
jgi:iron(III) transport system ATP-binding protein